VERSARIEALLRGILDAEHVEVIDESHRHAGHAGAAGGGGHFRGLVVSHRFASLGRIDRQRMVYDALADEMRSEIHALSIRALTPEEWRAAESTHAP
jgi:BolA family transcriptional regulator, general stress-responsive regulator